MATSDLIRFKQTPQTGVDAGNQSIIDYNLKIDGVLYLPTGVANTLNGGKDVDGAIRLTGGILNTYANGLWTQYVAELDGLKAVGEITVNSFNVVVNPLVKWRINSVNYQKTTATNFSITPASAGFNRIDLIYADTNSNLLLLQGIESDTNAVPPNVPANTVSVTLVYVSEDEVQPPVPDLSQYITRPQGNQYFIQASPPTFQTANILLKGSIQLRDTNPTIIGTDLAVNNQFQITPLIFSLGNTLQSSQILFDRIRFNKAVSGGINSINIIPPTNITSNKTVSFQDKDGFVALLSDIPDVDGFIKLNAVDGQTPQVGNGSINGVFRTNGLRSLTNSEPAFQLGVNGDPSLYIQQIGKASYLGSEKLQFGGSESVIFTQYHDSFIQYKTGATFVLNIAPNTINVLGNCYLTWPNKVGDFTIATTDDIANSDANNDYGQYAIRNDDELYILAYYSTNKRLKITFKKCMVNELMTFSKIEVINSVGIVTKDEFLKTGSVIVDAFTDYIGPYRVDLAFVGGNHLVDGFKTATTSYYDFLINGETIVNDKIIKSNKIDVRVTNLIFDPHFVSNPSPPTDIIEQVMYTIVDGKIEISLNSTIQRNGLTMQSYYGPQSVNINLPKLYVAHSSFPNGILSNFQNNTSYGSINSYPNIEKMIWTSNDNVDCMAVWIDRDYGLGKTVSLYNNTANSFVQTSNNKAYFYLIGEEQVFNSGNIISWHGGYNCFANQAFTNTSAITYTQPQGEDNIAILDFITNTNTTEFLSTIGQENNEFTIKKKDNIVIVDDNIVSAKGASIRSSGVGNIYLSTKFIYSTTPSLQDVTSINNKTQDRIFTTGANVPNGFPTGRSTWVGQDPSGAGIIESFNYSALTPNLLQLNPGGGSINIASLAGTGNRLVYATSDGTLSASNEFLSAFESVFYSASRVINANSNTVFSLTSPTENTSNGGVDLIDTTNSIITANTNDVIALDITLPFITPSGSNNSVDLLIRVKNTNVIYRAVNHILTKGSGNQDYLSASFTIPINADIQTNGLEIVVNPTAIITFSNTFISVTRIHKAR